MVSQSSSRNNNETTNQHAVARKRQNLERRRATCMCVCVYTIDISIHEGAPPCVEWSCRIVLKCVVLGCVLLYGFRTQWHAVSPSVRYHTICCKKPPTTTRDTNRTTGIAPCMAATSVSGTAHSKVVRSPSLQHETTEHPNPIKQRSSIQRRTHARTHQRAFSLFGSTRRGVPDNTHSTTRTNDDDDDFQSTDSTGSYYYQ